MQETMEQIQQEAYARGRQMKQWHLEQQRVVNDTALMILAADFAHMDLFKSSQHMTVGPLMNARVSVRERFRRVTALSFQG